MLFLSAPAALAAEDEGGLSRDVTRAIDSAAEKGIRAGGSPSIVVAVAMRGSIVFSKAYGESNLETSASATAGHIYRIGSLTKQFTAAGILKLAENGRLRIDDPLRRYFPDFPNSGQVTLRQLLNHTAGIHDDSGEEPQSCEPQPTDNIQIVMSIGRQKQVLDFSPGTAWRYSNANYLVLGGVIEKASGMGLREFMQHNLFLAANMDASAVDDETEVLRNRASGYTPAGGRPPRYTNAAYLPVAQAGGAGSMRSTVGDLCRWHAALTDGRVISPQSFREMMQPARLQTGVLASTNRFSKEDRASFAGTEYGMGLVLATDVRGQRVIAHNGGINGFASYLATYLEKQLTVAILTNCDGNPNNPMHAVRRVIVAALA